MILSTISAVVIELPLSTTLNLPIFFGYYQKKVIYSTVFNVKEKIKTIRTA